MPKNILFVILSEQAYPNVLSVKIFKPDVIVYLITEKMKKLKVDENFKKAIELNNEYEYVSIDIDDDTNINKIKSEIEKIWNNYKENKWIINITGGTKILSISVYSFFETKSDYIVYFPNNLDYYIKLTGTNEIEKTSIDTVLSVNELLTSYGVGVKTTNKNITNGKSIKKEDLCLYIAQNINDDNVKDFLDDMINIKIYYDRDINKQFKNKNGVAIDNTTPKLILKNDEMCRKIKDANIGLSCYDQSHLKGKISDDWINFFTGGWLEHFVYMVINEIKDDIKIQDLYMNVVLTSTNNSKNELDVVFSKGDKLYIIECKSGEQSKEKGDEALYKLKAIKSSINALSISLNLVTTASKMHDKESGNIEKYLADRAQWYNINMIPKKEVINLANLYSKKNKNEIVKKVKELFKIN
ncbi:MAG: Card1-like endonuclease domain-containing protein [Thermoplasmata archaeon]